jgi:heme/copper-type cytochrome/quinol oxidase subunit 4
VDFIESDWEALAWALSSAKSIMLSQSRSETMRGQEVNRISGNCLIVLSLIALVTVISGYFQALQPDEGSAAHIFQLSIVALVPTALLFLLVTVDWEKPLRYMRPLAVAAVMLVLAFGGLYYLEHYYLC